MLYSKKVSAKSGKGVPMVLKKTNFPIDDYTPNGYLDNPFHTYRLNQSGVIRSRPAIGFGWFFPHLGRTYGRRLIYSSHLNLAVEIDGTLFMDFIDFKKHGVDLKSHYHSRNIVTFNFEYKNVEIQILFFQTIENAICANSYIRNLSAGARNIRIFAINNYTRNKDVSGLWEEGLTGFYDKENDAIRTKAYSEGTIMLTGSNLKSNGSAFFGSDNEAKGNIFEGNSFGGRTPDYFVACSDSVNNITGVLEYGFSLAGKSKNDASFILARSETEKGADKEFRNAFASITSSLREKILEDNRFWDDAVQLCGDFPEHWRRGFVYDTETLRMNLRKPVGIYKHIWDAMQIQAPRSVLAEACFDALLISYSEPALAKELLLGTFSDAPEVWVPCTREDGSYNMIAWNGFPCGTAPEWGAPLWVVEVIYRRSKDKRWLRRIYPLLVAYLTWWENNRTDEEGFPHYLCSYESGQDMSERFGHQLGGGYDIRHIRPVDLTAAMCDSYLTLEFFAEELNIPASAKKWRKHADDYKKKTISLWSKDGWFHDYDRKAKKPTEGYDVMHLAPFFYRIAGENQCEDARSKIRALCLGNRPQWATFALMLAESAFNAGVRNSLGWVAYRIVDYVYSAIDVREQKPAMPFPGVEHEFWPMSRTWGAEGYGWGCFSIFLILRTLFGFRESEEDEDSFLLCPSLAKELMVPGKIYEIKKLKYRDISFDLKYIIQNKREFGVEIRLRKGAGKAEVKVVEFKTAQTHFEGVPEKGIVKFNADNFSDYLIVLGKWK